MTFKTMFNSQFRPVSSGVAPGEAQYTVDLIDRLPDTLDTGDPSIRMVYTDLGREVSRTREERQRDASSFEE